MVSGWIQWDIPDKQFLRWDYQGAWEKAKWRPQEAWMRDWLKSNPNFLTDHPSIEFIDTKEQVDG